MGEFYDFYDDASALLAKARTAYGERCEQTDFHHFGVLRWWVEVDEVTANQHVERLVRDINRKHYRAVRILAGFHADPFAHEHVLVGLCHRLRDTLSEPSAFTAWLQPFWYHGSVEAYAYAPSRRSPSRSGAVLYTAREPGTVIWSEWVRP